MRALGATFIIVIMLGLTGCSSTDEPEAVADEPETSQEKPADEVGPDCLPVPKGLARGIASGQQDGVGMKALSASAVRSPDYGKVFFVAVEFTVSGLDDPQVGVWASNSLKPGGGLILAVDGFAQEFTVWPPADETDAAISPADPSADEARDCLE